MINAQELREKLSAAAPTLWSDLTAKADFWTEPTRRRLSRELKGYPKTFNDPIWGDILFYPWETLLLDSPLLQRLRGVRQLGMAHLVYPGAMHDRLEHSRGVVEAAERMIRSLERNAEVRRNFGRDKDDTVPLVSDHDRRSIRIAALLHDIGHGAFSHATEQLIRDRLASEFNNAENVLRDSFGGVTSVSASEIVAVLLILTEPLREVFESPNFGATDKPALLPVSVTARILGSRDHLQAGYLSGVISGPLDADKLDYMARDCHHSGLPIGLDLHRLISKLEVVTVTANVTSNPEMKARASASSGQRYHEIGISLSGLGAYEQLIVGRAMLYDRLYYHHKVRSAEAMVRRLIQLAEDERGRPFNTKELFFDYPDDTVVFVLGGQLVDSHLECGKERSRRLATRIHDRDIHYRAFAFAPRFIAGISGLPDEDRRDVRALKWRRPLTDLASLKESDALAAAIFDKATKLIEKMPDLKRTEIELQPEDIVVDLPLNKVAIRGGDILTRTEDGYVSTPNLFFDPEKWSQAYEHQKQCGFVFTPREFVSAVGLASRIVFFEKYDLVMDASADRASKTEKQMKQEWFDQAVEHELCDANCALAYKADYARMLPLLEDDLLNVVPDDIKRDDPRLVRNLYESFLDALPVGLAPTLHRTVCDSLRHLFIFLQSVAREGQFVGLDNLEESTIQAELRKHLMAREVKVVEGTKEAGGETDLVIDSILVIENKVIREPTSNPLTVGDRFSWQARRYATALAKSIAFEVVAYRPKDETSILPIPQSVGVRPLPHGQSTFTVVRFAFPWGQKTSSYAKPK